MSLIHQLDKSVYNRISAGEVVESPYSVVKELIENAVDAKATEITISILSGGKDFIEVIDNGSGILKDDLLKTVMPHATSKISIAEDLDNIKTLGFRGEALASIAAVSRLTITSKVENSEIGYSFECNGGESSDVIEVPCKKGTKITVCDLFYNTPARRKFLKTDKSEENSITDMVARMVLANPTVMFKYYVDNKIVIESFGDGIDDAVLAVYGNEAINNSFKISNYKNGVKIEGFIGNHNYTKANRTFQTVILNGRYIINQTIQSAIHNAYSSYLMKRRYPFYVLYVTMPSEFVDVNVTPNKSDVRFIDNSVVYSALYSTVSSVLDGSDRALDIIVETEKKPSIETFEAKTETIETKVDNYINHAKNDNDGEKYDFVTISETPNKNKRYQNDVFASDPSQLFLNIAENPNIFGTSAQQIEEPTPTASLDIFAENKRYIQELEEKKNKEETLIAKIEEESELTYIGQVLNTYLIFERGSDVYFVDQHAAHERLLYNKLCYLRTVGEKNIQPLLIPFTLKVNPLEYSYVFSKITYLRDLGIEINENDRGEFVVTAIPCELLDVNLVEYFNDILQDDELKKETIPEIINERLMQKACKAAIKAGKSLTKSEVDSLMRLLNGNINLKCPHGRPIAIRLTRKEIDKWFKRIV